MPVARLASWVLSLALAEVALSGMVAVVAWLACRALRDRWPRFQQALWMLVLLRLVLPPALDHPLSAGRLLERIGFPQGWSREAESGISRDATAGVPGMSFAAIGPGPTSRPSPWAPLLLALWAAAVAALAARDAARARACRRLLRRASPVKSGLAVRLTRRWRKRLGIRRAVRIVAADARVSPFTVGVLHPVVFIPSPLLAGGNRDALAAALGHELAHVARRDVWWMRVERWVGRLYCFHPAVWVASRRLHAGRERICDAMAVSHGLVSATRYVKGLLDLLQLDLQGVEAPSLTLCQRRILMRLQNVLAVRSTNTARPVLALVTAALVGFFLLPLAGAGPGPEEGQTASRSSAQSSAASRLENPVPSGRITWTYGKGVSPFGAGVEFHRGIDLAAELGTPVVAAADGAVELATASYAPSKAAGTVIVLEHQDGLRTFYSHLGELKVKTGQRVCRGEIIAGVGNSGRSSGPHLHFEVWKNGQHVDPATAVPDWVRPQR